VGAVRQIRPRPDAVLVTGDLADHAADEEYELLSEVLAPLDAPLYVLPGNHDDRRALNRHFAVPGADGEPVQYSVDLGPLRLVVLDTTIPGEDSGALGPDQLDWLDAELSDAPAAMTLIAMHHPPLVTGMALWDAIGLASADRDGLRAVIERHPQVRSLVGGHFHRTIAGELAGRTVLAVPSTYAQSLLDFTLGQLELAAEPAAFALHTVVGGELVSHNQPVR